MILIVSRSAGLAATASEIFMTMGYVTECERPERAASRLRDRHRAVLVLGRGACADVGDFVASLRSLGGRLPIFAVRDDLDGQAYRRFDAVYPNSVYSSAIVKDFVSVALERGLTPIGSYRLADIDASVEAHGVSLCGERLTLTRTETAIVRYLVCTYPDTVRAKDILAHAFKPTRQPTEAGVRTHISSINRKAHAAAGRSLVTSDGGGYVLLASERVEITV